MRDKLRRAAFFLIFIAGTRDAVEWGRAEGRIAGGKDQTKRLLGDRFRPGVGKSPDKLDSSKRAGPRDVLSGAKGVVGVRPTKF